MIGRRWCPRHLAEIGTVNVEPERVYLRLLDAYRDSPLFATELLRMNLGPFASGDLAPLEIQMHLQQAVRGLSRPLCCTLDRDVVGRAVVASRVPA